MWVVDKIRVSVERTNLPLPASAEYSFRLGDFMFGERSDKAKRSSLCPNVITPDTIPEFCIPPNLTSLQEAKNAEPCRDPVVFRGSPYERAAPRAGETLWNELRGGRRHIIQVESVDDSPYDDDDAGSDEETTNADPRSQAALSLPHMAKTQTCYGFCTLLESPHTRRKESIFHSEPGSSSIPLLLSRSRSSTTCSSKAPPRSASSPSSFSLNSLTSRLSPRSYSSALSRQVQAPDSDDTTTTSSAESSPFGSPLLGRCPAKPSSSLFKALSHERLLSRTVRKPTAAVSRNNSLSTDESSSTDNSPNVLRRSSDGVVVLPNSFGLVPPTFLPLDLTLNRERVMKETMVPVGKGGSLRLSAEYCPDNQRLRVRLISAEGLYARSAVDSKSINCSVSLSLIPGKVQKQRSTVIRKSRNPIFNEDFFFDGISAEDIGQGSLRFKVVNKMSTMKRDCILGECDLPLSSIVTY